MRVTAGNFDQRSTRERSSLRRSFAWRSPGLVHGVQTRTPVTSDMDNAYSLFLKNQRKWESPVFKEDDVFEFRRLLLPEHGMKLLIIRRQFALSLLRWQRIPAISSQIVDAASLEPPASFGCHSLFNDLER
jgi:hypothetical protein